MLFGKKKKISKYLSDKQSVQKITAFDILLSEYLSGGLKENFIKMDMRQIEIHIDWLPDYKCIGIQGKAGAFVERIEGDFFSIMGLPICAVTKALKELKKDYSI